MNHALKAAWLDSTIGCTTLAGRADVALAEHAFVSNAINYCQFFTPGPANTIRNRVIGSEHLGNVPIAVACNFHATGNGHETSELHHRILLAFSNTNASGSFTITSALLTGALYLARATPLPRLRARFQVAASTS
jgi:hypothetical protein